MASCVSTSNGSSAITQFTPTKAWKTEGAIQAGSWRQKPRLWHAIRWGSRAGDRYTRAPKGSCPSPPPKATYSWLRFTHLLLFGFSSCIVLHNFAWCSHEPLRLDCTQHLSACTQYTWTPHVSWGRGVVRLTIGKSPSMSVTNICMKGAHDSSVIGTHAELLLKKPQSKSPIRSHNAHQHVHSPSSGRVWTGSARPGICSTHKQSIAPTKAFPCSKGNLPWCLA
jgi:hypothetical protein